MRAGIECKISLAKKLPITLGGAVTLPFSLGSFTNASPRYIVANGAMTGPYAGGTLATRIIGDKRFAQFEAAKTTINSYSDDIDNMFDYTQLFVTVDSNVAADPLGSTTSDKVEETTTASQPHYVANRYATTLNQYYTVSGFALADERTRFVIQTDTSGAPGSYYGQGFDVSSGVAVSIPLYSGHEYVYNSIVPAGNGLYYIVVGYQAPSTAAADSLLRLIEGTSASYNGVAGYGMSFWGWNIVNSAIPSSYISAGSSPATRAKDQFKWAEADVPAWTRTGFKARLIMHQSTDEMLALTTEEPTLFAFDTTAKGEVKLYFDHADKKLKWLDNTGALGESAALDWAINGVVDFEWNPDNGSNSTLKVDGGGVDTTYTGTQTAVADGDLYYGMDTSEANQANIFLISELEKL